MFSFFRSIPKPITLLLLVFIVAAITGKKEPVNDSQYVIEPSHPIWDMHS